MRDLDLTVDKLRCAILAVGYEEVRRPLFLELTARSCARIRSGTLRLQFIVRFFDRDFRVGLQQLQSLLFTSMLCSARGRVGFVPVSLVCECNPYI